MGRLREDSSSASSVLDGCEPSLGYDVVAITDFGKASNQG
jgi:hypothetical protein